MKNEYTITKKLIMSWAKEYHLRGVSNIILFILWFVIGVIGLSLIITYSIVGGDLVNWCISILFLYLSVFKLFFSRFIVWSNRYKLLSKSYGVSEWVRTIDFTNEEIILCDHTSVTKFKYENIKKIQEKNNAITIVFDTNLSLRLYKDAFVEGSWEECKDKINSMMK